MEKRARWPLIIGIALIVLLIIIIFLYYSLSGPKYDNIYEKKIESGQIVNPITELSEEDAIVSFNESFVHYILVSIKAYNLHNSPASAEKPKIEFYIGEEIYNAEVNKGEIKVNKGEIIGKDIIIRTTKTEAIKMLKEKSYIAESFNLGNSEIELIASKSTLFGKGYLSLYTELTGKSITGGVIRIYTE